MFVGKEMNYRTIAIPFFSGELVKLCFSSSFLNEPLLFVFLGMSIATTGFTRKKTVKVAPLYQVERDKFNTKFNKKNYSKTA